MSTRPVRNSRHTGSFKGFKRFFDAHTWLTGLGSVLIVLVAAGCGQLASNDGVVSSVTVPTIPPANPGTMLHHRHSDPPVVDWDNTDEFGVTTTTTTTLPIPPSPPPDILASTAFTFDSSTLTSIGKANLLQFVQEKNPNGDYFVDVTGWTDTTGTAQYNQALSQRRADAVKVQLGLDGLPLSQINATGCGIGPLDDGHDANSPIAQMNRVVVIHYSPESAGSASCNQGRAAIRRIQS